MMPFSHNRFDDYMRAFIAASGCQTWLDIGAGAGKFGKMIREILPNAHTTGIEVNLHYINQYTLHKKYDIIRPINCVNLMGEHQMKYDAIICGDILEHLPKSKGVDLLSFLVYHAKFIVVIYPIKRIQNEYQGQKNEAHISAWSEHDFVGMEYQIIHTEQSDLILIDGYLDHERVLLNDFA